MTEWCVGDRVQPVNWTEEARREPGVVIDVSAVDLDGSPMVAVDFPWSERYVVSRPVLLERVEAVEDEEESGYAPPALVESFNRLLERVTELNGGKPPATSREVADAITHHDDADELPRGIGVHGYSGDGEACDVTACGKARDNRIHVDFRLRFLEDIQPGEPVYVEQGYRWVYGLVVPNGRREQDGHVALIVQTDIAQRSIVGPGMATTPVPLEKR